LNFQPPGWHCASQERSNIDAELRARERTRELGRLQEQEEAINEYIQNIQKLGKFKANREKFEKMGKARPEEQSEKTECVICADDIKSQPQKTLSCNHNFHKDCVELWFTQSPTCPLCRKRE